MIRVVRDLAYGTILFRFTFSYYARFLDVTFVHKMYICVFLHILSHFCLMLNRERRESLRGKSLSYTH